MNVRVRIHCTRMDLNSKGGKGGALSTATRRDSDLILPLTRSFQCCASGGGSVSVSGSVVKGKVS